MSYQSAQRELEASISANYPLIYVVTDDERPVVESVKHILDSRKEDDEIKLFTWSYGGGLFNEKDKTFVEQSTDPKILLKSITKQTKNSVIILHDFHLWFQDPTMVLHLKEAVMNIANHLTESLTMERYINYTATMGTEMKKTEKPFKTIILTSSVQVIPEELKKLTNIIEFGQPGKKEITYLIEQLNKEDGIVYTPVEKQKIVDAALGLTESEFINAYRKASILYEKPDHKTISSEKKQIIKKEGLMDFEESKVSMSDVGGMKELINWTNKRKLAYDEDVRKKWNLTLPKGVLLTGIQGCGKSHASRAIANFLEVPIIRLDFGALMDSYLGNSEKNILKAIRLAETVAPCVLWIDEIDKGMPDLKSSNTHEATKRMASTLLTWLQDKTSPVFIVATANNIDSMSPELMRKGRFDEIFFIDLPKEEERKEIFTIHFKKRQQVIENFDLDLIVEKSDGFSGSEIEAVLNEALYEAAFQKADLHTDHVLKAIEETNPLSKTMRDKIEQIQKWAEKNNVRKAN